MSRVIDIYDEFKIVKRYNLSGQDLEALSVLYLPLIGLDAFGFYNLLNFLPNNEYFAHKVLYDFLGLNNITIIQNAKNKLEAIGLLDSFVHHQGKYLYLINPPLGFEEFDNDTLLSNLLRSHIGTTQYDKLVKTKRVSIRGYKNITKKFNEVFDCDIERDDLLRQYVDKKMSRGIQLDYSFFDYLIFKDLLGNHFFDEELLEDAEFKDNIYRIAYIYKLNEEEMKETIIKTYSIENDFNYEQLSKNARKMFQEKNHNKDPLVISKANDAFIRSKMDTKEEQLIHILETTHPTKMLEELSGIKPSVAEIKIVEDLLKNTNFPPGVINVMILMVNTEKQGVLPSYNYFEKIANTWARADIKTTHDAFIYITKPRDTSTKSTKKNTFYKTNKKETKTPDWYQDYEKELEQFAQTDENDITQEEREQIIAEAKKFFS